MTINFKQETLMTLRTYPFPAPLHGSTAAHSVLAENLLFVGANGSGKSRLGAWFELNSGIEKVHRVAAQRGLEIEADVQIIGVDQAQRSFLFGNQGWNSNQHKWGGKPTGKATTNYQGLLQYLFAENAQVAINFKDQSNQGLQPSTPQSKSDQVIEIWNAVFPHRRIDFKQSSVVAFSPSQQQYHSSEMSDGERVALYLIGTIVCVPADQLVIIDEPELHIHKAVQARLWDAIENARPDIGFIYITHDLDFASSRLKATKYWLEKYDGSTWSIHTLPTPDGISERVMMEVLGSRKKVLFIEGDLGSLDETLYRIAYPEWHIKPVGSCEKVIQATKGFNGLKELHHNQAVGIIDRDFRQSFEISLLAQDQIHVLPVSEIENVLLTEPMLAAMQSRFAPERTGAVQDAKQKILDEFSGSIGGISVKTVKRELRDKLRQIDIQAANGSDLNQMLINKVSEMDANTLLRNTQDELTKQVTNQDYKKVLAAFDRKSLCTQIAPIYGLDRKAWIEKAFALLRSDTSLMNELKELLPSIQA